MATYEECVTDILPMIMEAGMHGTIMATYATPQGTIKDTDIVPDAPEFNHIIGIDFMVTPHVQSTIEIDLMVSPDQGKMYLVRWGSQELMARTKQDVRRCYRQLTRGARSGGKDND